jgi:hypothetical protein
MIEKIESVNKQLNDGLKRRIAFFLDKYAKTQEKSATEWQKGKNLILIGYKYEDVNMICEGVDNLLVLLDFAQSKLLEGKGIKNANKTRISRFVGGFLNKIQLRPFKNGVALVIWKDGDNITVDVDIARKEVLQNKDGVQKKDDDRDKQYGVLEKIWQGDENGLHQEVEITKKEDVWGNRGGVEAKADRIK